MTISQISIFTESKPGHLARTLQIFEDAHVNVRGYSVSDTGEYGIARFIVDKPDLAVSALQDLGFAFTTTQVLCLELDDRPGELARIMNLISECGVNVIYSYSMIGTFIIIATTDIQSTKELLSKTDVRILHQQDMLDI